MMRRGWVRSIIITGAGLGLLGVALGCTTVRVVPLVHESQPQSTRTEAVPVVVLTPAVDHRQADDRNRLGQTTWSLFALPDVDVTTAQPVGEAVASWVAQVFTESGWPATVARTAPSDALTVTTEIRRWWISNYTGLWPILPTWSTVELEITVTGGHARRSTIVSAQARSFCPSVQCGLERATRQVLTEAAAQVRGWLTGQEIAQLLAAYQAERSKTLAATEEQQAAEKGSVSQAAETANPAPSATPGPTIEQAPSEQPIAQMSQPKTEGAASPSQTRGEGQSTDGLNAQATNQASLPPSTLAEESKSSRAPADPGPCWQPRSDRVNVRKAPSATAPIVGQASDHLTGTGRIRQGFIEVYWQESTAWVAKRVVRPCSTQAAGKGD
jgi:hypothetical protein